MTRNIVEGSVDSAVDTLGNIAEDTAKGEYEFSNVDDAARRECEEMRDLAEARLDSLDVTAEEAARELEGEIQRLERLDEHDQIAAGYNPERAEDLLYALEEATETRKAVDVVTHQEDRDNGYL